ncbi:Pre-mRNA-splicing factor slt11 [Dispira simplex]|nr:Pre-mRNA-splicing factor slt11 [Dispira simplex]
MSNLSKEGWKESEFPILCETCLGENPYMRMTRQTHGRECKICERPFTIFRWCPGRNMRYKKTEICQTCAKLKNICQTCMFDLEYGLPVQVRDNIMNVASGAMPQSDVNREYFIQNAEKQLADGQHYLEYEGADLTAKETLRRMARKEPYYKRNRAHICSFFVKGECTRGQACPYRHELPTEQEQIKTNFKDRYYGNNDPLAKRVMEKVGERAWLQPPEDLTVTSLFITGVTPDISQGDVQQAFAEFGEVRSVVLSHAKKCAFVNFLSRAAAELAAEKTFGRLAIKGIILRVAWGKPRKQGPRSELAPIKSDHGTPTQAPLPPGVGQEKAHYPSQDPTLLGAPRQ